MIDAFLVSKPVNKIAKMLSESGSKYKLNQMSVALVCEYIRNVGADTDTEKPDEHMMRMIGSERLGVSKKKNASSYEVINEFYRVASETGMWVADFGDQESQM